MICFFSVKWVILEGSEIIQTILLYNYDELLAEKQCFTDLSD